MEHQPNNQQQQNRRRGADIGGAGQNHPAPQPCPRCNSNNTKFCYFNNYSLSQPRFFCKGCRRYWTQGGTLRNVPVGGGCRKSKRPRTSSSASTSAAGGNPQLPLLPPPQLPSQQLLINAHDHHQQPQMFSNSSNISAVAANSASGNAVATAAMMGPSFYAGESSGFFSSLAAIQAASQPLTFGSNLGLLQGFGLPTFEQHHLQQQQGGLQNLYPMTSREVGSSSSSMENWSLRMATQSANPDPNSSNNNNANGQTQQWSDFLGTTGLDDSQ